MEFRSAAASDVPAMAQCRLSDPDAGPADPRMAAYFNGQHHPRKALRPRTGFVAVADGEVVGYIAGHRTTRYGYSGEVQYLYVAPHYRRRRIATKLLSLLAEWFQNQDVRRVCVNVNVDSPAAVPFYRSLGAAVLSIHWYTWEDIRVVLAADRTI